MIHHISMITKHFKMDPLSLHGFVPKDSVGVYPPEEGGGNARRKRPFLQNRIMLHLLFQATFRFR